MKRYDENDRMEQMWIDFLTFFATSLITLIVLSAIMGIIVASS